MFVFQAKITQYSNRQTLRTETRSLQLSNCSDRTINNSSHDSGPTESPRRETLRRQGVLISMTVMEEIGRGSLSSRLLFQRRCAVQFLHSCYKNIMIAPSPTESPRRETLRRRRIVLPQESFINAKYDVDFFY